jgi:nicotinate-nucleotide pyrophosphorylase (carboxylating)
MKTASDKLDIEATHKIIDLALEEDIQTGDLTTDLLVPDDKRARAVILAKEGGVISGLPVARMVFDKLSDSIRWNPGREDGDRVSANTILVELTGPHRAILTGERVALNFLQRLSGIATLTSRYVSEITDYNTRILDTRKTVPGLRVLDKYAVASGGGDNHRFGLYDMVMIKDNHIEVAGGILKAVNRIRRRLASGIAIEVETKNLDEVREALEARVDMIMLDNMSIEEMRDAVKLIKGQAKVEASGNMSRERLREVAETGVDVISIGALTHSAKALDISLYIDPPQNNYTGNG